jgi:hypothetical protein
MADDEDADRLRALLAGRVRLVEIPATGGTAVKRRVRVGDHSVARIDSGAPVAGWGRCPPRRLPSCATPPRCSSPTTAGGRRPTPPSARC